MWRKSKPQWRFWHRDKCEVPNSHPVGLPLHFFRKWLAGGDILFNKHHVPPETRLITYSLTYRCVLILRVHGAPIFVVPGTVCTMGITSRQSTKRCCITDEAMPRMRRQLSGVFYFTECTPTPSTTRVCPVKAIFKQHRIRGSRNYSAVIFVESGHWATYCSLPLFLCWTRIGLRATRSTLVQSILMLM